MRHEVGDAAVECGGFARCSLAFKFTVTPLAPAA
jgi:hypothetical protein